MFLEEPKFEVVEFEANDVIVTSGCIDGTSGSGENCFNNSTGVDDWDVTG